MRAESLQRARQFGITPRQSWQLYLVALLSAFPVPLLMIVLGLVLDLLVTRRVPGGFTPESVTYEAGLLILLSLGMTLAFLESLAAWFYLRLAHRLALQTATRLKQAIRKQAFRLGPNDLLSDRRSRPEELFSDKADTVRAGLVSWWQVIPRAPAMGAMLLVMALVLNFWLSLLAILLAVFLGRFYAQRREAAQRDADRWSEQARQRHHTLLETFRLAPLISGYSLSETPGERFESSLEQYQSAAFLANTRTDNLRPWLWLVATFGVAFFLLVAGVRQDPSVARAELLMAVLVSLFFPASRLLGLKQVCQPAEQASHEIFSYLDREPSVAVVANARALDRLQSEIRFENVTLADRAGKRLLDNVSFTVTAKERWAILASDPHVPVALAGLLVRYYDPAAGRILFDGHDLRQATLESVRGGAVFVAHDGPIFDGTVFENIACGGSSYSSLQIADAARRAQAFDFIQQLPQGFNTALGEMRTRLTIDQSFRLGLARAFLREPSLLVINEPSHEPDEAVAAQLDAALQKAAQQATTLVLANRVSTLRSADHVLLLHRGALHALGKHADLVQSSDLYRHLIYLRSNPFRETEIADEVSSTRSVQ